MYELINNLYNDSNYVRWKQRHSDDNIWRILNKTTDELSHSKFLAYILDSSRNGTLDDFALLQFLRLLVISNINKGNRNKILTKYQNNILTDTKIVSLNTILCEKVDRHARYDIFIEMLINNQPVTLIIENKVTSSENVGQTDKYEKYSKDYKNPILVYLSVKEENVNEKFITITYQQLLDNVLEPSLEVIKDERTKSFVMDYINILGNIETKDGSLIMAISKEERELLKSIYENNKELINKMFEAISDELEDDEKEALKVLNSNNLSRNTKWKYNGESVNSKQLVRIIVKEQLESGNSIENLSQFKMHSSPLVVKDIIPNYSQYDSLQLKNGDVVYVRNCCARKDVENLIKELKLDVSKEMN